MGGDEIVADWLGDINSFYVTTSSTVTRFSGTALRYRNVHIFNPSSSNAAWIGWYNSNATTFMNFALINDTKEYLKFEYIDLYELAFYYYASTATVLKVLCINKY